MPNVPARPTDRASLFPGGRRGGRTARLALLLALLLPALACAEPAAPEPTRAAPGYAWSWPRDHGAHDTYRSEWWYYTGHLDAVDGSRTFGFQLTFFRSLVLPGDDASLPADAERADSAFAVSQMYWAHFAVSDLANGRFHHAEVLNRGGIGVAGARSDLLHVWNGRWSAEMLGDLHHLRAELRDPDAGRDLRLRLVLTPTKPIVLQGDGGYSQKAAAPGQASLYYSIPRLRVDGVLFDDDRPITVRGAAWLDREFGSSQLQPDQVGWDWFALQLDDQTELMVYAIRRADGSIERLSTGSFVRADGFARTLRFDDTAIRATRTWTSPHSGGVYPASWEIEVPSERLRLTVTPNLADQELHTRRTGRLDYWEGSVRVEGARDGQAVGGRGYVELVGYAAPFDRDI